MSNFYISQTAIGSGDASSATNAAIASFFNTVGNWSAVAGTPGKISPGDTVYIVGTVSTPLVFQGSGDPGQSIVLTGYVGGKMSAPTWTTSAVLAEGDLFAGLKHDITVDSLAIEATDSGTGLTYPSCGYGVRMVGISRARVSNCSIQNLFVRTVGNDTSTPGLAISCVPAVNAGFSDVSIYGNTINNGFCGVNTGYNIQGLSNVYIHDNIITNVNWGIQCGSNEPGATVSNLQIYNNTIFDFACWDEPGTNFHHHNAVFVWTNNSDTTGTCTGLKIFNNAVGPGFGTYSTSGVYVSAPGHRSEILIYNNTFNTYGSCPTNGDIFVVPGPGAVTRLYNNTHLGEYGIANGIGGDHGGAQTFVIRGSIVRGNGGTGKVAVFLTYNTLVTLDTDKNSFSGLSTPTGYSTSGTSSGAFKTFAQWQALGYDLNTQNEINPTIDGTYQILAGSPVIGAGENLSAYFNTDKAGITRSVPWDMGAFKYAGAVASFLPSGNGRYAMVAGAY